MSILEREIAKTPFAVIDVESTGLSPRHDRIAELAIVVVRPGEEPQVVFDSLIRPDRRITATEIHGITDDDVADAPTFADVAPSVVAAFANRVACSHNVYFDVSFLRAELERCGHPFEAPHVCSMLLPRLLDPGVPNLSLARACERWRIEQGAQHAAVHDAMAAAKLLREHLKAMRKRGLRTFADLKKAGVADYKFLESFGSPMLPAQPAIHRGSTLRPRGGRPATGRRANIAEYLEALLDAAADLRLDAREIQNLQAMPARLELQDAEVRAVHTKVFWAMLGRYVEDARIDLGETEHLRSMRELLAQIGWAPGDAVEPGADDIASC